MWISSEEVLARFNGTYNKVPLRVVTIADTPTPDNKPRRGRPKKDS